MSIEQNPFESSSHVSYLDRSEQSILDPATTRFVLINQVTSAALIVGLLTYLVFSYSQINTGVIPLPPTFIAVTTIILVPLAILLIGLVSEFTDIGFTQIRRRMNAYADVNSADVNAREVVAHVLLSMRSNRMLGIHVAAGFFGVFLFSQSPTWLLLLPAVVLILSIIICIPIRSRFMGRLRRLLHQTPHSN